MGMSCEVTWTCAPASQSVLHGRTRPSAGTQAARDGLGVWWNGSGCKQAGAAAAPKLEHCTRPSLEGSPLHAMPGHTADSAPANQNCHKPVHLGELPRGAASNTRGCRARWVVALLLVSFRASLANCDFSAG